MKIRRILLLFILIFLFFVNVSYAANEAEITLVPSKSVFNKGEELSISISVENTGIQSGITDILGVLNFDDKLLELDVLKKEELTSEQQAAIGQASELLGLLDILSVKDKCLIGGIKDGDSYLLTVIFLDEQEIIKQGELKEIGTIKFKISDSTTADNATISFSECEVNGEFQAENATTNVIISDNEIVIEENETIENTVEQEEIIENEEIEEEIEEENLVEEEIENEESKQEYSNESKEELLYTGTEDFIPFIFILIILSIFSYMKYIKYKNV